MIEKTCTRCLISKSADEFTKHKGKPVSRCKQCRAEHWLLWHQGKRADAKEQRENRLFNQLMADWPVPGIQA